MIQLIESTSRCDYAGPRHYGVFCANQLWQTWQTLQHENIMSKSWLIELHQAPANKTLTPKTPTPPILPFIMAELVSQQDPDWTGAIFDLAILPVRFSDMFLFLFFFFSKSPPSRECISCSPGPCKAHAICIRPCLSALRCVMLCFNLWSQKKLSFCWPLPAHLLC